MTRRSFLRESASSFKPRYAKSWFKEVHIQAKVDIEVIFVEDMEYEYIHRSLFKHCPSGTELEKPYL